jgi:hypothetical protein
MILGQIPEVKIKNYAFKNNADLTFTNVTDAWGFDKPSFSNGAAYVDLDNDGDLDVVINNINSEASLYKNNARQLHPDSSHFLKLQFRGDSLNKNGLGAYAFVYYDKGKMQSWENTPYRGYLSSIDSRVQFGLGKTSSVDSVIIKWPNGTMQAIKNLRADTMITVSISMLIKSFLQESLAKK